jgi:hypothetical protein
MVPRRLDIRRSQVECKGHALVALTNIAAGTARTTRVEARCSAPRPNGGSVPRPKIDGLQAGEPYNHPNSQPMKVVIDASPSGATKERSQSYERPPQAKRVQTIAQTTAPTPKRPNRATSASRAFPSIFHPRIVLRRSLKGTPAMRRSRVATIVGLGRERRRASHSRNRSKRAHPAEPRLRCAEATS